MSFINIDLTRLLTDEVVKEDKSAYEFTIAPRSSGMTYYHLQRINNEISCIMGEIPEEYAQDLYTAWEAISRITSKMKGESRL